MSHVSRHAHAFEHTRRERRGSDRTGDLKHRTMRLRTTAKMMALHHTLKSLALADANDVDKALAIEDLDQHAVANFDRPLFFALNRSFHPERHFAHELHRRKIVLRQMSLRRLGEPRLFYKLDQSNLGRLVSVFGGRLVLRHHT